MTRPISVSPSTGEKYKVYIDRGLSIAPFIKNRLPILVYDGRLKPMNIPGARKLKLPSGEKAKTFSSYRKILDLLIKSDTGHPMVLIAFGGGAVGDVVGFAAATYRRGIPFLQVPTTVLAMVDASVGGKTAINHPDAKNMIGAFHQPEAVLADLNNLKTLPVRQIRSGLVEVLKHGLIADKKLFEEFEKDPAPLLAWDSSQLENAIAKSVRIKGQIVAKDALEKLGIREFLNLGHTLAHAIESVHNYRGFTHGEAVSIGLVAAGLVSKSLLNFQETERIEGALANFGLPIKLSGESSKALILATKKDKKRRTSKLRMTLLTKIESPCVKDNIAESTLATIAKKLGAR